MEARDTVGPLPGEGVAAVAFGAPATTGDQAGDKRTLFSPYTYSIFIRYIKSS